MATDNVSSTISFRTVFELSYTLFTTCLMAGILSAEGTRVYLPIPIGWFFGYALATAIKRRWFSTYALSALASMTLVCALCVALGSCAGRMLGVDDLLLCGFVAFVMFLPALFDASLGRMFRDLIPELLLLVLLLDSFLFPDFGHLSVTRTVAIILPCMLLIRVRVVRLSRASS